MRIVRHDNRCWWGRCITLITDDGLATITVNIEDKRKDAAALYSLKVHESVRRQGRATLMLCAAETEAKAAGCEQTYLSAEKSTWLPKWYERRGYRIYCDNEECEEGHTVAMNKMLNKDDGYYILRALLGEDYAAGGESQYELNTDRAD